MYISIFCLPNACIKMRRHMQATEFRTEPNLYKVPLKIHQNVNMMYLAVGVQGRKITQTSKRIKRVPCQRCVMKTKS